MISLTLIVLQHMPLIKYTYLAMFNQQPYIMYEHATHRPGNLLEELAIITTALSKVISRNQDVPRIERLQELSSKSCAFIDRSVIRNNVHSWGEAIEFTDPILQCRCTVTIKLEIRLQKTKSVYLRDDDKVLVACAHILQIRQESDDLNRLA